MSEQQASKDRPAFNPQEHLIDLRGKGGPTKYLPVQWRLVWLRTEHPNAHIHTEAIEINERIAIFKATVSLPGDGGSATGFGSETPEDFRDYIEKGESRAIGRALAALGYGTQFSQDFTGDLADSPVEQPARPRQPPAKPPAKAAPKPTGKGPTKEQIEQITKLATDAGMAEMEFAALKDWVESMFHVGSLRDLSPAQAGKLIGELETHIEQARQKAAQQATDEPPLTDEDMGW